MKFATLAAASLFALTLNTALVHAEDAAAPVAKTGTHIATIQDGNKKVEITTAGVTVEKDGKVVDADDEDMDINLSGLVRHSKDGSKAEEVLVPLGFFLFLIVVILGGRFLSSRNEQRRLELLRTMVEKGQAVPESVVTQLLSPESNLDAETAHKAFKRTRNAYAFTIAGALIIGYCAWMGQWNNSGALIPGLVFLSLGVGGLFGVYSAKTPAKKATTHA